MTIPARGRTRPKTSSAARERLLDVAGSLFHRYGFQAVGIDRILAEAGVAKMTLYRHFASKDELIAAYLDRADAQFWTWAEGAMAGARTSEARLIALFDALGRLAASPTCLGCVFQGAAMAFPDLGHPGHRRALVHKLGVRDRLATLAREARLRSPDRLAAQLMLLMDGAWVAARMFGPRDSPAAEVKEAASRLIDAHRAPSGRRRRAADRSSARRTR
jgi:AcrR family transcriptional regulator